VPTYRACLVDVFDTVLSVDIATYAGRLARHAGVTPEDFGAGLREWSDRAMDGSATLATAFREVLVGCGLDVDDAGVDGLVAMDRQLLGEMTMLHLDAVPFLESLRERGVRTAFVSNCAENTRPMLAEHGLSDLVDELVLSCEVRAAKPDPAIFELALERLGMDAGETVFVDDQQRFCDAAAELGIHALTIDRSGSSNGRNGTVTSLAEVTRLF
jgi:HAD superfamily hydrolase (TIGR01509 family)